MAAVNGHSLNGHANHLPVLLGTRGRGVQAPDPSQVALAMEKADSGVSGLKKGFAMSLRRSLGGNGPGYWSQDHWEQTQHYVGWNYIAIRAMAMQCAKATVQVVVDIDDEDVGTIAKRRQFGIAKDYDNSKLNQKTLPRSHRLVRLLNRPNPTTSGATFRYEAALQLGLTGVCLIWKVRNQLGLTVERYVIPTALAVPNPPSYEHPRGSWRITPLSNYNGYDDGFLDITGYGAVLGKTLDANDVQVVRWPHPLYKGDGYGPLAGIGLWSDSADQVDSARWHHLKQGPDPSLAISPGADIDVDETTLERMAEKFNKRYSGPEKSGKAMFLAPGTEVKDLGHTAVEMAYAASFEQLRNAILAGHMTPPIAAGVTEGGSYSNFVASLRQYISLAVQPTLNLMAEEDTEQTACDFSSKEQPLTVLYDAEVVDDPEQLERELTTDIQGGYRKVNEFRKVRGLEPLPDAIGEQLVGGSGQQAQDPAAGGLEPDVREQFARAADPIRNIRKPSVDALRVAGRTPLDRLPKPDANKIRDAVRPLTEGKPAHRIIKPIYPGFGKKQKKLKPVAKSVSKKAIKKCAGMRENGKPVEVLNGDQAQAARDILKDLAGGTLTQTQAHWLLVSLGIPESRASEMTGMPKPKEQKLAIGTPVDVAAGKVVPKSCGCDSCKAHKPCPCGGVEKKVDSDAVLEAVVAPREVAGPIVMEPSPEDLKKLLPWIKGAELKEGSDFEFELVAVDHDGEVKPIKELTPSQGEMPDLGPGDEEILEEVWRELRETSGPIAKSAETCEKDAKGRFGIGNQCAAGKRKVTPVEVKNRRLVNWDNGKTVEWALSELGITKEEAFSITGAPEDAQMKVYPLMRSGYDPDFDSKTDEDDPVGIEITVKGKLDENGKVPYEMIRHVMVDPLTKEKYIKNEMFRVARDGRGKGLGVEIFARQVATALQYGYSHIETEAAGSWAEFPQWNGYYIWPKFGYDGELPRKLANKADQELGMGPGAFNTIQDLYATPEGEQWWQENGGTIEVKFDLSPGSKSLPILNKYLEKKGWEPLTEAAAPIAKSIEGMSTQVGSDGGYAVGQPVKKANGQRGIIKLKGLAGTLVVEGEDGQTDYAASQEEWSPI